MRTERLFPSRRWAYIGEDFSKIRLFSVLRHRVDVDIAARSGTTTALMGLSCLVEPLVKPLVARRTGGLARQARLGGSALAMTAIAASALLACANPAAADQIAKTEKHDVVRSAHKKPKAISYRAMLAHFQAIRRQDLTLDVLTEAPDFETEAVRAARWRHAWDTGGGSGPVLRLGMRIDRLLGAADRSTFLRFGSGQHRSGSPTPA